MHPRELASKNILMFNRPYHIKDWPFLHKITANFPRYHDYIRCEPLQRRICAHHHRTTLTPIPNAPASSAHSLSPVQNRVFIQMFKGARVNWLNHLHSDDNKINNWCGRRDLQQPMFLTRASVIPGSCPTMGVRPPFPSPLFCQITGSVLDPKTALDSPGVDASEYIAIY